jgi:hypothetical protein
MYLIWKLAVVTSPVLLATSQAEEPMAQEQKATLANIVVLWGR